MSELRNLLERALILGDGLTVGLSDLPSEVRTALDGPRDLDPRSLQAVERRHVARMLEVCGWNKTRTAKLLGIDRKTLYAKLKLYGLEQSGT